MFDSRLDLIFTEKNSKMNLAKNAIMIPSESEKSRECQSLDFLQKTVDKNFNPEKYRIKAIVKDLEIPNQESVERDLYVHMMLCSTLVLSIRVYLADEGQHELY